MDVLKKPMTRSASAELAARQGNGGATLAHASAAAVASAASAATAVGLGPGYVRSSEEIFLRDYIESGQLPPAPSMSDVFNFPQVTSPPAPRPSYGARLNSEELFNSWITTTQPQSTAPPPSPPPLPPSRPRRVVSELRALMANKPNPAPLARMDSREQFMQTSSWLLDGSK
eukprot:SM003781S14592  [mRNA]  locus=s3781:437:1221:- [translate_table: standard]